MNSRIQKTKRTLVSRDDVSRFSDHNELARNVSSENSLPSNSLRGRIISHHWRMKESQSVLEKTSNFAYVCVPRRRRGHRERKHETDGRSLASCACEIDKDALKRLKRFNRV